MSSASNEALDSFIDKSIPRELRGNFDRDISMIRGGWNAGMDFAIAFFKPRVSTWSRNTPNKSGLWWWWNEDEDSCPIPVEIGLSGGIETYFATAGQHGWTLWQDVKEMGGFWMECVEPKIPDVTDREKLTDA